MIQTININSNINLHYIPMEKLKTTAVGIYIHRPLCEEDASYNAVLPFVLKRGCALCDDSEAIAKYLENLYGASFGATVMKYGENQPIYFDAEVISDRYAPQNEPLLSDLLELLLSVIFEPVTENGVFKTDITEREKVNALNKIEAEKNNKRQYASDRCQEEMCKGETYAVSRFGTREGVEKITAKNLYEYYKNIITSSVIDIYICGDADISLAEKKISEKISSMQFEKALLPKSELHITNGDVKNVTERMDVVQGKLSMGFTTSVKPGDADFMALQVMNSVFGAGAHSKLFNNVREKLSLAYYASSQLIRYKGLLVVNSGIEFENFQKAYDEILIQLESIKNGEISDLEFDSSINALLNAFESLNDDQRAMQGYYMGEKLSGLEADIEARKRELKSVTKADVAAVAKKIKLDTVYFLAGKEEK